MRHYLGDFLVVELEDVLDHLFLVVFDVAGLGADVYHHPYLFLGNGLVVLVRIDLEQTEDAVGGSRQDDDERSQEYAEEIDHARDRESPLLGIGLSNALRHEFSQDKGEKRQYHGYDYGPEGLHPCVLPCGIEVHCQRPREIIRGKSR